MSTLAERPSTPIRNPLLELHAHGQSIWLDYIRRNLITSGELKRLVGEQAQGDYQALLDDYLDQTVFCHRQAFNREEFKAFLYAQSQPKPDPAIYKLALDVTQKTHEECCFIDDRPLNLEGARQVGMRVIQFQDANQLRRDLAELGVTAAPAVPAA